MIVCHYRVLVCRDDWDAADWECAYYNDRETAMADAARLSLMDGMPRLEVQHAERGPGDWVTLRVFHPKSSDT